MSTSVIGEEPSAFVMTRSTSLAASSGPSSAKSVTTASSSLSTTEMKMSQSKPRELEPGCAITQYTTIPALFQRIAHATEEVITVYNISCEEFTKFFEQREGKGDRCFRLSLYIADTKCLIITIPRKGHEGLHRGIDDRLLLDAGLMGLDWEFMSVGSTTFMKRDANRNITLEGEGDSCRIPLSTRPGEGQYPTLVIEACWSQTIQEARQKARWWFCISDGDVKIVLIVKAFPISKKIRIEKWKNTPATARQGATTTRAASATTPECVHAIEIARAVGINNVHPNRFDPASYVVTNGPLQLEFIDVFLRQPIPPGERDLIISNVSLQRYAANIWKAIQ